MSSLPPPTTRSPRFTCVSDGNPLRRLLLTSKAFDFEVHILDSHDPPLKLNPDLWEPRQSTAALIDARTDIIVAAHYGGDFYTSPVNSDILRHLPCDRTLV